MRLKFIIVSILVCLLLVVDICVGTQQINFSEIFVEGTQANNIFFIFRMPKVITALLAGIALSVSGLLMQTIFRNPLAGPDILGVSAGASLGVALFLLGVPLLGLGFMQNMGMVLAAWIGAAAVMMLILVVSSRLKDIMAVLILGMMLGSAASALISLLQYFSSDSSLKGYVIWSMGSLGGLSPIQLMILGISTFIGLVMAIWAIKPLNLLLLGENYARSMGLNIILTRSVVFGATSLLAGSVTAFCGPLAFVGIAAPHVARMIFRRADHRILLPASALTGAVMMLMSDIIWSVTTLPINTITSLLGIPIVILVVFNTRKNKLM